MFYVVWTGSIWWNPLWTLQPRTLPFNERHTFYRLAFLEREQTNWGGGAKRQEHALTLLPPTHTTYHHSVCGRRRDGDYTLPHLQPPHLPPTFGLPAERAV